MTEIDGVTPFRKAGPSCYQVGRFMVDVAACTVTDESRKRRLEPKAMEVLAYFLLHPGRVISRAEIEDTIWKDQIVGYDALSNAVIKIRRAFADNARHPTVLETIPKSGFRLLADVREDDSAMTQHHDSARHSHPLSQAGKPSIAVIPFRSYASDTELHFLKQGIAEDLIVDLSKSGMFFVIAASSSFSVDEASTEFVSALAALSVDYYVAGSFQSLGTDLSMTVRLTQTSSDEVIWADRYQQPLSEFLLLSSRIFDDLIANFGQDPITPTRNSLSARGTDSELAYSHFLKGREQDRLDTAEANDIACDHFSSAIAQDPAFSSAYSYLSRNRAVCYINRWSNNRSASESNGLATVNQTQQTLLDEAFELANTSVELAADNPHAHFAVAASALWLRQHELAIASAETSLKLDNNFAEGFAVSGMIQIYAGSAEQALVPLQTAMHHDPHFRDAYQHLLALALYHLGKYQPSIDLLLQRLIRRPESDASHMLLAACYGQQGDEAGSRAAWGELLAINPAYDWSFKRGILPYQHTQDLEQLEQGLRFVVETA